VTQKAPIKLESNFHLSTSKSLSELISRTAIINNLCFIFFEMLKIGEFSRCFANKKKRQISNRRKSQTSRRFEIVIDFFIDIQFYYVTFNISFRCFYKLKKNLSAFKINAVTFTSNLLNFDKKKTYFFAKESKNSMLDVNYYCLTYFN